MRLNLHQIRAHLQQPLLPVYLVAGDEPLQKGETLDQLRQAARDQGYTEREVLEQEAHFDWSRLYAMADSLSLFGDRRVIELRLNSAKIGTDGSKALLAYARRPPQDTVLLVICSKLDRSQTASKWVKTLEQTGALLTIWPVDRRELPRWLEQRMHSRGLHPAPGVSSWLAERVEGNLLAATQEIEKLLLLHGPGPVDQERMQTSVADSSRYTIFDLADSALEGRSARCMRILEVLCAEGTAEPLVLWALAKEVRLLARIAGELRARKPLDQVLAARREIWNNRRPLYGKAVKRLPPAGWRSLLALCARADRVIKGVEQGDPWLIFSDVSLGISGIRLQR